MTPLKQAIVEVVNRIPPGSVTWYGAIAQLVGEHMQKRVTAKLVGRQLSGMSPAECQTLPRRRVIAKTGAISAIKLGEKGRKQKQLLEKEHVIIENNRVDMDIYAVGPEDLQA